MSRKQNEIGPKTDETLRLGAYVFDLSRNELRDAQGDIISLRAQSADVLAMLGRTPNEIVNKDMIVEAIWNETFVTDDSLVQCIGDIRRALGDSGRDWIETIPRRGYRLNVRTKPQKTHLTAIPRRILLAMLAIFVMAAFGIGYSRYSYLSDANLLASGMPVQLFAPVTGKSAIAVLPFANMSVDPEQLYFSDGLSEDLITDLSQVSNLMIVSSASSFAYRDTKLDIQQIARELGVRFLLRGSVRKANQQVRINATLIDASNGATLWAARFDRDMKDIFALQDEITKSIVDALSITLSPSDEQRFERNRYADPDAYDLLLRGLYPLRRFTADGILEAQIYFKKAIALDPDYARAHANMALSYGQAIVFRLDENRFELIEIGLREADIAEKLDDTIPHTQFARAVLNLAARNHTIAIAAARRAIELDGNYADGFAVLAQASAYGGNLEEGLAAIQRAKQLNPRVPFSYLWVEGHIFYQLRRYDQALLLFEEVVKRNPSFYVGLLTLAATLGQLDRPEDADWYAEEILVLKPDFSAETEGREAPYMLDADRRHFVSGLLKAGLPI